MQVKILSIIVPSYNMEAYLPKCLRGLVIDDKELLGKLDVIVVNDGSKDRTSEIAHSFETKYPGVFRVIDKTNGHYGSCINAALPVAEGEYVKILDADIEAEVVLVIGDDNQNLGQMPLEDARRLAKCSKASQSIDFTLFSNWLLRAVCVCAKALPMISSADASGTSASLPPELVSR